MLWLKESFVYFRKRPYIRMCKINSLRLTSESNREQSQIIYSVCLCCFVFKEFPMNGPMNGNYWQTGGVDLPLGQQYLPLNRKPRIWLPVVDYPTPALQSGKTFCATFLRIFICGLKCSNYELKLTEKLLSHVVFQEKIHFQVFQKRVRTRTKIGLAVQVSKTNTAKGHFW